MPPVRGEFGAGASAISSSLTMELGGFYLPETCWAAAPRTDGRWADLSIIAGVGRAPHSFRAENSGDVQKLLGFSMPPLSARPTKTADIFDAGKKTGIPLLAIMFFAAVSRSGGGALHRRWRNGTISRTFRLASFTDGFMLEKVQYLRQLQRFQ
jgi:hypothetical protein